MNSFLSIKEIKSLIQKKQILPQEVIAFYHKRLKTFNPQLNVALELFNERELTTNVTQGPLVGIPGLLKDNIAQEGKINSCGSKILSNYRATYDATVTQRLKAAGAVILGRTNMDEFAMGSSGEFSAYGPTLNPWNGKYSPGGSSSGSAAAVAAGLVPWALGTETGGSVRQPAAFCGIVGLYPTYGRFSRNGLVAFASSTDEVGPLTRTVYDNALIASILSGHDSLDSTSVSQPKTDFTKLLNGKIPSGLKIGIISDALQSQGINDEVKAAFEKAVRQLESLGATIKTISLSDLKYGISVYFILSRAEAASNLARFDGTLYGQRRGEEQGLSAMYIATRDEGFGDEVKRRILLGNYVLAAGHREAYYAKAMRVRALIREEFENAFSDVDVLISPTTSTLPFRIGHESKDPLAMYISDYFTVPMCIAGIPALSVPCGFSESGLPIGFQFIGPRLAEPLLYQVAYAYEQSTDHHLKTPAGF